MLNRKMKPGDLEHYRLHKPDHYTEFCGDPMYAPEKRGWKFV